ncbi:hypothetical protein D3C72_1985850 [compost metagenome]
MAELDLFVGIEFEAIVIHGHGKADGIQLADAVGDKCCHDLMDQSAFQGVEKQMMAFPGFDMFDEKFRFARHGRKFGLFFDQWCQEMKLFFT